MDDWDGMPGMRVTVIYHPNPDETLEFHLSADGGYHPEVMDQLCNRAVNSVVTCNEQLCESAHKLAKQAEVEQQ